MLKVHCSACGGELHQSPAELLGPPDISRRSRKHQLCRTCFDRIMAYWPTLREKAETERAELRRAIAAGPGRPAAPTLGETRSGRRGILGR